MKDELREYMSRPRQYTNIDGTGEMVVGVTLLGFALGGYLEGLVPDNSTTWMRVAVILTSLALAIGFAYWTRRAIKQRLTWPRTGYVAYPRGGKSWWLKSIAARLIALSIVIALAFLARRYHAGLSWNLSPKTWNPRVILLVIISLTAYAVWVVRMGKEHWWKWLVLLFMVLGTTTLAVLAPRDFGQWARPPVLFIALLWLGSGLGTLCSYVRHTKPVNPQAE